MKPHIWLRLLLPFCLTMVPTAAVPAAAAPVAAHVVTIEGTMANSYIEHGNLRLPITYWAALEAGDRLVVIKGSRVIVHYTDGRPDVTVRGGTPYVVGQAADATNQTENFLHAAIEDLLKRPWRSLRSTVTRDDCKDKTPPLFMSVPGLTGGSALIQAGDRSPAIQWHGGVSPFHVVVGRSGDAPVIDMSDLNYDKNECDHLLLVVKAPVRFEPGVYELTITDVKGDSIHGSFRAVSDGIPTEDVSAIADPLGASLIAGTRLAQTRDPRYALEALFRLAPALDQDWGAADAVADAIAKN
jgi:hypothetical protein